MKKQQKIIELRTEAKIKVDKLKVKIANAKRVAAEKRARLLWERAFELEGLEAGSAERLNLIAKYKAEFADDTASHVATVAQLKSEIQQVKENCERQCAAAEDDQEPVKEQQETVYCDGSEHAARIVARRLINKMPRVKCDGALFVHIVCDADGDYFVSVSEQSEKLEDYISTIFSKDGHCEKSEAQFVERARKIFKTNEDKAGIKATEPMARALDAVFGGNPVAHVDNLIADTIKDGKEGGNE